MLILSTPLTLASMNSDTASKAGAHETVYMVEAYRAAGESPSGSNAGPGVTDPTVLGVIDVPGDEVVLFLIAAPDAATADRVVRDGGGRPIRVVPVQWDAPMGGNRSISAPAAEATIEP